MEPCRIWSVCLCFCGRHGVDLYPGRLGMPSREMVPFRGLVLGPEPQAIAGQGLCAAGQREWVLGLAPGCRGSLGGAPAQVFVRQGACPGRLRSTVSREIMHGRFHTYEFLATPSPRGVAGEAPEPLVVAGDGALLAPARARRAAGPLVL